jgi:hypothetical protein
MRDASAFMIKGDAPLATRASFSFIIGDAHKEHVSPFYQRSGHVSDINLTEMHQKVDRLLLPSTEPVLIFTDVGTSHFSRSKTIVFTHVSDLSPI